jgi:2-keto-4-pentenoate hydratase/2-oxohepta-3-ene-1,7-dioic acid hydratase in catechol pathway
MMVATYGIGGERRVGLLDERRKAVSALDLPLGEAEFGVLALFGRDPLPPCLSLSPLSEVELEAPIPRPRRNIFCIGKNYHEHAKEFAASGFDTSAASGVMSRFPIVFSKVPESVVAHREAVDYEAKLGVIIGKGERIGVLENELRELRA